MAFRNMVCAVVAALAALGMTSTASAQSKRSEFDPTALELARLPLYCQGQFRPELAAKDPAYRMPACGPRFNHFCPALVSLMRAQDPLGTPVDRNFALKPAGLHLKYTIDSMPASCPLAPEVKSAAARLQVLQQTRR